MTLEASVSTIVGALERQAAARDVGYSIQRHYDAMDVASGIRESGLSDSITSGFRGFGDSLVATALTLGVGLSSISQGLADSNRHLTGIENSLRTPLATAARERYQRGTKAFERGWLPEAEMEFGEALVQDPYLAVAHLMLALTILRDPARAGEAATPLSQAIRYGTPDEPSVATGAALLLGRLHRDMGEVRAALEVAKAAHATYPTCPELGLLRVQLGDDPKILVKTFRDAPELAQVMALTDPDRFVASAASTDFSTLLGAAAFFRDLLAQSVRLAHAACDEFAQLAEAPMPSDGAGQILDACEILLRADAIRDAVANRGRAAISRATLDLESEIRTELQVVEAGSIRPMREQVGLIQADISLEERDIKELERSAGTPSYHPQLKQLQTTIADLLCRAVWGGRLNARWRNRSSASRERLG